MSKIGRKPIQLNSVNITVNDNIITYKGKESFGEYKLPKQLVAHIENECISLLVKDQHKNDKDINMIWGLHRALLNNLISGSHTLFVKSLKIDGLGFKVENQGSLLTFHLGFSHKINYEIPSEVYIEIDKTKQNITLKSAKKDLLGHIAATIKGLRPVEPYKGKGISYANEKIFRKAGKTK